MHSLIQNKVASLIQDYGTRDPFRLCALLDISLKYIDTKRQKGFCKIIDDCSFIFINRNMSEQMQRMTCAHELGHLLLHRQILCEKSFLLEYELFDMQNAVEYEANIFASLLLIDQEDVQEMMKSEADMVSIASALDINVNLLMIWLIEMQKTDDSLQIPFVPDRKFMGSIKDAAGSI